MSPGYGDLLTYKSASSQILFFAIANASEAFKLSCTLTPVFNSCLWLMCTVRARNFHQCVQRFKVSAVACCVRTQSYNSAANSNLMIGCLTIMFLKYHQTVPQSTTHLLWLAHTYGHILLYGKWCSVDVRFTPKLF